MHARFGIFLSAALLLAFAAFICGCERTTRDTDIKLISVSDVKSLVDQQARGKKDTIVLIDPRPRKYYEQSHIPAARHLTLPEVPARGNVDPSISRFSTIVVYGDDPASASARGMTKRLMAVGYRGVLLFAGGMKEWKQRGYPVEGAGEPAPESPAQPEPPQDATPPPDSGGNSH